MRYTLIGKNDSGSWGVKEEGSHCNYWPSLVDGKEGSIIVQPLDEKKARHIVEAMNRGEVEDWMQKHISGPYDRFDNEKFKDRD